MKKSLQKLGLGILAVIVSVNAWSQCPTVDCPTDIVVSSDSANCGAAVNYTLPTGIDLCDLATQTFNYTGTIDTWVVPSGVTTVTIEARGAEGSYNTTSSTTPGLGAIMIGDVAVTPGSTLSILVGQQYSATGGNGGGGGTFVVDAMNTPLMIAGGGGGSSQTVDSPEKHGQVGITGGTGAGGGGLGGTAGSGGSIGASFASGAGGGLLTNGANGWTTNTGGIAFISGGAGGSSNGNAQGGFGGGGSGSSYVVGGGGGGYSGGGSGSNSAGAGVGGGGASYNAGANQINTGGANTGHGTVIISYGGATTTTFESGIGTGGNFPVGVTTETYSVVNAFGDSAWCSFTVTVIDSIVPTVICPADVNSCDPVVSGIAATTADNCSGETVTYNLTGATTGSGSGDASGTTFNVGTTTVWYIATDASGNMDSSSFNVIVNALPVVVLDAFTDNTMCVYHDVVALPSGTPAGGTYSGTGVTGSDFDPSLAGNGTHYIVYSYTDTVTGCINSDSTDMIVDGCIGVSENPELIGLNVYPNPSTGLYTVEFNNTMMEHFVINITDINGKSIYTNSTDNEFVKQSIDLREESNGVYFMEISSESQSVKYRLVKN